MSISFYDMCLMNQKLDFISKTRTKTIPKDVHILSKDRSNHKSIRKLSAVNTLFSFRFGSPLFAVFIMAAYPELREIMTSLISTLGN